MDNMPAISFFILKIIKNTFKIFQNVIQYTKSKNQGEIYE